MDLVGLGKVRMVRSKQDGGFFFLSPLCYFGLRFILFVAIVGSPRVQAPINPCDFDTFWQEDAEAILAIPTDDEMSDWLAWYFESHRDVFAYILAVETADGRDASPLSSGQNNDGIFIWRFTQDKEKRSGTGYSMPSMQET
uniref:Uncharacterized protein n=1 Tax=Oryza punctata TaxID=4537 RepID=A0A0E0KIX9_ORYPU